MAGFMKSKRPEAFHTLPGLIGMLKLIAALGLFRRNGAATLAFAGVLSLAACVAGLAATLTLAIVLALAIMLRGLGLLLRLVVLPEECGSRY
jgi:hypothetical protein